ncbi:MAG TPA: ABC transporter permease subunit [Acidobacteriaceae bacterium]
MNPLHINSSVTRGRETLARAQVLRRTGPVLLDMCVAAIGLAIFYAIVRIGMLWAGPSSEQMVVSMSPRALPMYAFYSIVRIFLAYLFSLVFAIIYGYLAAYNTRLESFMIAALDILQSIPVLSFLPPVMLAMIALFPTRHFGVELGAILLLFTGAVWNMAFSFYSSIKSIPRELREAADINRFSWLQRLVQLELPYAAIGLVWNSIMSVAGAWFTLMACEMFHFGSKDFRLPGLGSYLQTAADLKDGRAIGFGLVTMIAIIVAIDQLIWRPLIGWSDKFKFEQVESTHQISSPLVHLFTRSNALAAIARRTTEPLNEAIYIRLAERRRQHVARLSAQPASQTNRGGTIMQWILFALVGVGVLIAAQRAVELVRPVPGAEYIDLLKGAGATFLRVNFSLLLAAAWTIPVGVAIGSHPRLARLAQPLAQIAASVPATALFPVVLLLLIRLGGGLGIGSIALMLLGTQWYILFNVIAGAMAIPTDLKEVATLFRFSSVERWKKLILPGIFPFLVTGMVTASGGAWNASIFAEYFTLDGKTLTTLGLGEQINAATANGEFPIILLGTILISIMVVTTNRLVWRKLYRLAETRYRLD